MSGGYRIGIDLGGTKTEGVILGEDPIEPIERIRVATPRGSGYAAIVDAVCGLVESLRRVIGGQGQTATVGIGIPGTISATHGRVKNANTNELIGHPFRADLETRLEMLVRMENDANCFALAEALHGAGAGARCVFGVILGTGVGGGIVFDGRIWSGAQGIAGEWGHMTLDPDGPDCYCGRRGCVETFLSGPAVERIYREVSGESVRADEIWTRAAAGDAAAAAAIESYRADFGFALAQVVNLLDPDVVVLGGGVSKAPGLAKDACDLMRPHMFNDEVRTVVRRHQLGDSAGVLGAAWLGASQE